MSKSQRDKGAAFERETCSLLNDELGVDVGRNLGQSRDGGDDITLGKYRIECKRRASIALYEWWEQVNKAAKVGEIPVLAIRADRKERLWVIDDKTMMMFLRGEI